MVGTMRIILLLLMNLLIILPVFSQKVAKNNAPKQLFEEREEYIFEVKFEQDISKYKEQILLSPDDPDINFKLGYCMLNSKKERYNSIEYFRKAIKMHDNEKSEIPFVAAYFYLGRSLYLNYKFDEAIDVFSELLTIVERKKMIQQVKYQLFLCNNAKEIYDNPVDIAVTKMGVINSEYPDHSPIISADESIIYFTSKRKGGTGNAKTDGGLYYEDIYSFDKKDGFLAVPKNLGSEINTGLHEATCGLSVSGQELFLYKSENSTGDIYYSKLNGTKWSTPLKLGKNINSTKRETHASLSADGKYLYFTSDRKGGFGGLDIYVSKKESDGTWGTARNLGRNINTKFDEESPFIHPDGQTIYFSSKGHNSMGGYDIFYSNLKKNNNWLKPVNMGFPLNTIDNELYYVSSADGLRGYYVSQRGKDSDIYSAISYSGTEKALAIVSGKSVNSKVSESEFDINECKISGDTLLLPNGRMIINNGIQEKGDSVVISYKEISDETVLINDTVYYVPDNTQIYIIDIDSGELVNNFSPNSVTGDYLFVLPLGHDYKIYFDAPNHIFDTENISLKEDSSFVLYDYSSELDSIQKGQIKKSKTTPFEDGETALNKSTILELDLLAHFLNTNRELLVNVSGFDYLLENSDPNFLPPSFRLSVPRMDSITNYLVDKGVSRERIYSNVSDNMIFGDVIEYTIFDEITLAKALADKKERLAIYQEAFSAANIAEDEIEQQYGEFGEQKEVVSVQDMLFDINSFSVQKYDDNLSKLASYLKENKDAMIEIGGYTDLQGPKEFNEQLALKRAKSIQSNLAKQGVDIKQITVKNYSTSNPISRNVMSTGEYDWEALVYNRRVEIKVLKQGENKNLEIKKIQVPKEYSVGADFNPDAYSYSVNILSSDSPIPLSSFSSILQGVKERKEADGTYIYYYGSFKTEEEAQDELPDIRDSFPEAFIFIKDF